MDIETKKRIATELLLNVSAMRHDRVADYMAENGTWWDLASRKSQPRQQFIEGLVQIKQMTPTGGVPITIKRVIAEGNRVVIEEEAYAKLPNGYEYRNNVVLIFEFGNDGKVTSVKEYLDPRNVEKAFGWS